jgi:hypothetical protein
LERTLLSGLRMEFYLLKIISVLVTKGATVIYWLYSVSASVNPAMMQVESAAKSQFSMFHPFLLKTFVVILLLYSIYLVTRKLARIDDALRQV